MDNPGYFPGKGKDSHYIFYSKHNINYVKLFILCFHYPESPYNPNISLSAHSLIVPHFINPTFMAH